ncbi:MAG: hypothetical protein R2834_03475 [Rhodothermales bacterium]
MLPDALLPAGLTWSTWPWFSGIAAFLVTILATPAVIRLAHARKWVAQPKADRWHEKPTALMGGIALYAGAGVCLLGLAVFSLPWSIWIGATLMFVTGLVDDLINIRPATKLVAQVLAAGVLVIDGFSFGVGWPAWVGIPVTFLWLIGITNALNLLDNMDGLAAGIAGIAAMILALFSSISGDLVGFSASMAVTGAAAGFLVFNFKPARIFMGDSGSLFLGYMIAAMSLVAQSHAATEASSIAITLVSVLVMAIPIFDTTLVTIVRKMSGRAVSQGGRDHSSHRLVFLGLSERRAVLTLYGISLLFGLTALTVQYADVHVFYALMIVLGVSLAVFGVFLASVDVYGAREELGFFSTRAYVLSDRFFAVLHTVFGRNWKASFGVATDLLLIVAAYFLAHMLRFEDGIGSMALAEMSRALPVVIVAKISVFYLLGLYNSIWRHAGAPELVRTATASLAASLAAYVAVRWLSASAPFTPAVAVIDGMITTFFVAAVRFGFRGLRHYLSSKREAGKRVLLYGAGDAGMMTLRELRQNADLGLVPIGFIDDDPRKHGMMMQGIPVVGSFRDLERIISAKRPEAVLITAHRMTHARKAEICTACTDLGVECRVSQLSFRTLAEQANHTTAVDF